jgi:hypothetical protein
LQFFAHCYSLNLAITGLQMFAKYTMPNAINGCVFKGLDAAVGRIAASIAVAGRPVNKSLCAVFSAPPY